MLTIGKDNDGDNHNHREMEPRQEKPKKLVRTLPSTRSLPKVIATIFLFNPGNIDTKKLTWITLSRKLFIF